MIHHATKKKLAEKGITIQETPEGDNFRFSAFWESTNPASNVELWGNEAKALGEAMVEARMLVIEHHVQINQDVEDGSIEVTVGIKNPRVVGKVESVEDLPDAVADILEELTSEEVEEVVEADAVDAEEEDAKGGSVVPETFKKRYAEAGHPGTCGDWLANALKERTTTKAGKLDVEAIASIAAENKVDLSKLNTASPGWQGRYRMTARNMMVKVVAAQGFLLLPTVEGDPEQLPAPAEWAAANKPKVKEAGDKKAARRAKGA